jgi:hypothetical protein
MENTIKTFNHKRFLLFSSATYYPEGGMWDLFGTYDTAKEAIEAIETIEVCNDNIEIYDRIEGMSFGRREYNQGKTIYTDNNFEY